ncbi:MAG TPA: hypothetical protein VF666_21815 [Pyrinomonadaceae bacterium]|jgi:hypothetical protein
MKNILSGAFLWRATLLLALTCAALVPAVQAQTAGGTQIQNRASATYSDGSNNYSTVSNLVTITVANVSGLTITPDNPASGSNPSVVSGETNVDFSFTVTNSSNFATQVRFLQSGASLQVFGPGTIQAAVIDLGTPGMNAGDTDIFTNNAGDVLSASVARNASIIVIVRVNISAAANPGDVINVRLGDTLTGATTYDNQPVTNSANEVRTASGASAPVNGESEARGDASAIVQADARIQLSLNAPAGPVALGSNITYTWGIQNLNTAQRPATAQTLAGAPAGSNSGIFVVAPVPVGTTFVSVTPPAGVTVLYSNSALSNDPLSAATVWSTTAPAGVTRVAFNVGNSLAIGASVTNMQMVVQINTNANASTPIYEIGDAFARNSVSAGMTDQSGDSIANKGDGNANFNEPRFGVDAATPTQGFQLPTLLTQVGNVLLGPNGFPDAVGPTNNNDDFTNRSVSPAVIAGLGFGDPIGSATFVDFTNTIRNSGNANDTFALTAPTVPPGFTVQVSHPSINGGTFTAIPTSGTSLTLALNFGQDTNIVVRVTAPVNTAVLNGFATTIRATSGVTNTNYNETINRLYTGFLRLTKSSSIVGGGAAVPGATVEYVITYANISTGGGTNCPILTASNIVISEDGNAAPNNWATYTTQVIVPLPADPGGAITDGNTNGAVTAATSFLKDTVSGNLLPGASGTFTFRRRIN